MPSTSEGSLGPALPSVKVPCEGEPAGNEAPAREASSTSNSNIEASVAAPRTVDEADVSRRTNPPPRKPVASPTIIAAVFGA
jgi:hypothetical protein